MTSFEDYHWLQAGDRAGQRQAALLRVQEWNSMRNVLLYVLLSFGIGQIPISWKSLRVLCCRSVNHIQFSLYWSLVAFLPTWAFARYFAQVRT